MQKLQVPNKIINIKSISDTEGISIINTEGYFRENFNFKDIYDRNKFKNFIKNCEKMIRASNEYSRYIGNLKNDKKLHNCAILGNIDDDSANVEFHHYPFTLYDIIFLAIRKNLKEDKKFNSFSICREVLRDHAENLVGLVPLCEVVHELVHDGKIFVNLKLVFGKINDFIEKYYDVLSDDMIENYNKLEEMTENNAEYSDEDILKLNK